MTLENGEIVEDRYRIEGFLARGGMGAVYRAWDLRLNRPVCLKELIPQPGLDAGMLEQLRQQFQHEAQVLATLVHPYLVRVTDYFSWRGNEYLVMDFVEGESLAQRIKRLGPQNEEEVLRWAGQLLDALSYCHRHGVIHRDIKPQNIIITPDGDAVLVDFGLVKLWDPNAPETRTAMRGAGTPEYAPPEQYDLGLGHTDPRSDIYSLGATLYHALTGKAPPTATQRIANPSCFLPPRRVNAVVSPLTESAVLRAMEVVMEHRFRSAVDMAGALGISLPSRITTVPRSRVGPEPPPPARKSRRGLWIGLAVAGVVCLVTAVGSGVTGLVLWGPWKASPTPPLQVAFVPSPSPVPTRPILPTETPRPTTQPTPSISAFFQDDFSDPNSGWEVGNYDTGSVGYAQGTYSVVSYGNSHMMWGLARRNFADVVIEVDALQVSAPSNNNNAYGVMCRVQEDDDGYVLRISGDGYYAIHRIVDGRFEPLVDWTSSSVIRQGNADNHIRAVCDGSHLLLEVNGELLAEAQDTTYAQGDIALTVTSFESETTEVRFDNLRTLPPGAVPLTAEILFQDDFSDPDSGWEVADHDGGRLAYADGSYSVVGAAEDRMIWGVASRNFADLVVDVDATQVSAPANNNNAYGIFCRVQPGATGDGYAFLISGDGFYSIQRITGGDYEPLVNWSRSDVIRQGNATNHIQAVCNGDYLALIVNGELLAEARDGTYTEGDIALVAGTLEAEPTEILFDNLVIRRPAGSR